MEGEGSHQAASGGSGWLSRIWGGGEAAAEPSPTAATPHASSRTPTLLQAPPLRDLGATGLPLSLPPTPMELGSPGGRVADHEALERRGLRDSRRSGGAPATPLAPSTPPPPTAEAEGAADTAANGGFLSRLWGSSPAPASGTPAAVSAASAAGGRMAAAAGGGARAARGGALPDDVAAWSGDQVCAWLGATGYPQYVANFRENDIDGLALLSMGKDDLTEMGVKSVGHRLAILRARDSHGGAVGAA